MQISGKNVILTGAASGIGRALLEKLLACRACVLAVDCDMPGLEAAMRQAPGTGGLTPHVCDLGQPEALEALFECALRQLGTVDIFIANAGFAYYERIDTPDWEHIQRLYQVNVFAPLYAAEKMRQLHPGQPYKVVITASAMGLLGLPGYALYSSTKAALHRFAEAYRFELDDPRSLVLVYPIGTRTAFFRTASQPATSGHATAPTPWPTQTAKQVAQAILNGILHDQTTIYPSIFFRIFMHLPLLPRLEQAIEARRLRRWLAG